MTELVRGQSVKPLNQMHESIHTPLLLSRSNDNKAGTAVSGFREVMKNVLYSKQGSCFDV